MKDIEDIIRKAEEHGEESEPDMEVGDLQEIARILWSELTESGKEAALERIKSNVFAGEED